MGDGEQVLLRQRLCRACGAVFYVCRSCDRGQRYCSERCRERSRREQRRAANRRHQRSPEGRLDHRDRQREYRRRLVERRVRDQGSGEQDGAPTLALLMVVPAAGASSEPICCECGRRGTLIDPFTG